jgi:hypothetical protein
MHRLPADIALRAPRRGHQKEISGTVTKPPPKPNSQVVTPHATPQIKSQHIIRFSSIQSHHDIE